MKVKLKKNSMQAPISKQTKPLDRAQKRDQNKEIKLKPTWDVTITSIMIWFAPMTLGFGFFLLKDYQFDIYLTYVITNFE